MPSFKQLFLENLKLPNGFSNTTPPKATFQIGNIVVVRPRIDSEYNSDDIIDAFQSRNPQKNYKLFQQAGKIVGYKSYGMSSKFAVFFEKFNSIAVFNTAYLVGPFVSFEAAEQAAKHQNNKDIPIELFSTYVKRENVIPKNSTIEEEFKKAFVNTKYNFEWLDEPIILHPKSQTRANLRIAVLAVQKQSTQLTNKEYDLGEISDFTTNKRLANCLLFFKLYNVITGQFVNTKIVEYSHIDTLEPIPSGNTGYCLQIPYLNMPSSYLHVSLKEIIQNRNFVDQISIATIGFSKTFSKYLGLFQQTYDQIKALSNVVSEEDYFDLVYNVKKDNSTKIVEAKSVDFDFNVISSKFKIEEYKIIGDCKIALSQNKQAVIRAPKAIGGDLYLDVRSGSLLNLKGIPSVGGTILIVDCKNIFSLEGCPEKINGNLQLNCNLPNLVFLSKQITGSFIVRGIIKSFNGGEKTIIGEEFVIDHRFQAQSSKNLNGLPKASKYNIGIDEETIKDHLKFKPLKNKLPELGDIF